MVKEEPIGEVCDNRKVGRLGQLERVELEHWRLATRMEALEEKWCCVWYDIRENHRPDRQV